MEDGQPDPFWISCRKEGPVYPGKMIPAAGILAAQLQGNFTSTSESLYAVEALRYLLAGILVCPFKMEKKEIRRPPKDGSEVAWLELAEIRKGLEGTDGW